jgi:hypothetical protein
MLLPTLIINKNNVYHVPMDVYHAHHATPAHNAELNTPFVLRVSYAIRFVVMANASLSNAMTAITITMMAVHLTV